MKGMLRKALGLKLLWKTSKLDAITWIVAVIGTLLLDVVSEMTELLLLGV